jgi:hypothetical protein
MTLPPGRKPMSAEWFAAQAQDFSRVNRVEVIDNQGRAYVKHDVQEVSYTLQDGGQTLKLFLTYEEPEEISID